MSALWSALDDIDVYYGSVPDDDDDDDAPKTAPVAIPRPARSATVKTPAVNLDALTDAPSGVELSLKGREALHPSPIRARQRFHELLLAGDPDAIAIARACVLWLAQRAAAATVEEWLAQRAAAASVEGTK